MAARIRRPKMREYRKPTLVRISRNPETEKLYTLEERRNTAIRAAASELGRVLSLPTEGDGGFWFETVPQALFDLLESFDRGAARIAAEAFIEHHDRMMEAEKKLP